MHLLVCDDDPAIGKLLQSVYKVDGWQVDVVTSGQACIDMVAESPPDVIILDHMMPGMTGVDTARTLRSRKYTNPIVLFSGYIGPDLDEAIKNLDLMPVSKIETQTIIRIIDVLGSRPHLGTKTLT